MRWLYFLAHGSAWLIGKLFFRFRVVHPERLIEHGPCIIASNHVSFFDPPAIAISFRRPIHFLARKTLFRNRAFGWLIRNLNSIPVDQDRPDMASLKTIIRLVKDGQRVLIFPEGSRSLDGSLGQAEPGVGLIIAKTKAQVLPMRIFGAREALPRGAKLPRLTDVSVVVGQPLDFTADLASGEPDKQLYQRMSERVLQAIAALEPPGLRRTP